MLIDNRRAYMTFSIIVVCLNAGDKLHKTIESIFNQTESDYEIVVKDGGSTDDSVKTLLPDDKLRVYCEADKGIYDAMNQAVAHAKGDYICFLNCGDYFYDKKVLSRVKQQAEQLIGQQMRAPQQNAHILYGNILERKTGTLVQSNPVLDDFACYRNLPCHQACFYDRRLFDVRGFDTKYKVRADYEHFLWCLYEAKAKAVYMPLTVASYEGGGYSETKTGLKHSRQEHREIVGKYIPAKKVRKYRMTMLFTLAPLRTWLAGNKVTAGVYQKIKKTIYSVKG